MHREARARRVAWMGGALGLAVIGACGLDSGVHPQNDGANGGDGSQVGDSVVSAGGTQAWDASTTPIGSGNDTSTAGSSTAQGGGIGSGGAGSASGGPGGAIHAGGATGAGGSGGDGTGEAGAAGEGSGSAGAPTLPHALYFSEYVEGSSTNKALEVAASERSSLNGCTIQTYFNGKSEAGSSVALVGELAAGQVWTVCTPTLANALGAACRQTASLTFNGNDALALSCDGVLLDAIGQIGFDPSTYWGSGDARTADRTLRRACGVTRGDSDALDAFEPSREWLGFPLDAFDGLGSLACDVPADAGADAAPDADAPDAGSTP